MSSQHNLRRNPARESQRAAAIAAKSSTQARPSPQGKIPSSKLLSSLHSPSKLLEKGGDKHQKASEQQEESQSLIKAIVDPQLIEKLMNSYCDVCFTPFQKAVPRKLQEGLQILRCSRCECKVHKCCYDFEASGTVINQHLNQFLCDRCRKEQLQDKGCLVCQGTDGAMKEVDGQLCHVFCGLVHNDIDVTSYYPSISFRVSASYQKVSDICELCSTVNACDKCAQDSCSRKVHAYCAIKHHKKMEEESQEQLRTWNYHVSMGNHGSFNLSEEVISYKAYSEQIEETCRDFDQLQLPMAKRNELKQKKYNQYCEQSMAIRRKANKLRRGGFSYVLCDLHQQTIYCSCMSNSGGEMVLCECCHEWYHQSCVKYEEISEEQKFVCSFCRSFYELKRKMVEQVRMGSTEGYQLRADFPAKMSLMDFAWVLRAIDRRVAGGSSLKMLKQLTKYPLKTSCLDLLLRCSNRNKLQLLSDQFLVQYLRSEQQLQAIKPRAVLALDHDGRVVPVPAAVDHNHRVRKFILLAEQQFQRRRVAAPFGSLKAELDFKTEALSDSYDKLIELSKVEQNYEQVPLLKLKANAYSFLEVLKKINNQETVSFEDLKKAHAKAQLATGLSSPQLQLLHLKIVSVQPVYDKLLSILLQSPDSGSEITALLAEFHNLKVEPPEQYRQYNHQKALLNELYIYYIKHQTQKMEEETSFSQKISSLKECGPIKASQQLVEIIGQSRLSTQLLEWPGFKEVLEKFICAAVDFEVKDALKRRFIKHDKVETLMAKIKQFNLDKQSEDIANLEAKWILLREAYEKVISASLADLDNITSLSGHAQEISFFLMLLDSFPLRFEDDQQHRSWASLARTRKDQVDQLLILFTESQLHRNPLTIAKILPGIPRSNPLVRQYYQLKKEQNGFVNKFTTILARVHERMDSFKAEPKKQRKEQIKENSEKPTLSEITEFIETLTHSKADMGRQIKDLTRMVNNSLQVAAQVRRYLEEKTNWELASTQQLAKARKEIDQLRRLVLVNAELNLKTELTELYHAQICNRMRTSLLSSTLQLDKIGLLLKFADEEKLTHHETYRALKEKFETKSQKSKEYGLIKNFEQQLAFEASKDTSATYVSLYSFRKNLALPDVHANKGKNSSLDQMADKNRTLRQKITQVLQQRPKKFEFVQAKAIYLQALKNPFFQPDINRLNVQINRMADVLRRWKELGKSYSIQHPIFLDYDNCSFIVEEVEIVKKELTLNEADLQLLQLHTKPFNIENRHMVEDILQRIEQNAIIKDTEQCQKAQLIGLGFWHKALNYLQQNKNRKEPQITVPFEKIKKLLTDAYNLLQNALRRNEDTLQFRNIIDDIEDLVQAAKSQCKNVKTEENYLVQGFIDVEELCLELETADEQIQILRPFSDLGRFKNKNLLRSEYRQREDLSLKRLRPSTRDDQPRQDSMKMLMGQSIKSFDSAKYVQLKMESSQSEMRNEGPQTVKEGQRKKIKEILLKNILKNPELSKYGDCENEVKMIQNQIFGEWHNDVIKYFETSQQFEKLFIKLINCPHMSSKLAKKKFEFKFIQLLVTNLNKIEELESIVLSKMKEQRDQQSLAQITEDNNEEQTVPADPLQIDQKARKTLRKEIKMIKEAKNKKKKHHKHRSKSRSEEAQFSSESEKQLPSYIQNEYAKETKPGTVDRSVSFKPLLFDPDAAENEERELTYPKGCMLKLKECEIEIALRKKGKVEMRAAILTDEDYNKVSAELVDPGFARLSLRKEKGDEEIIQYINKSKKKYKYLVSWLQGTNAAENDNLKELSVEANERHKIFGWQNEHIKIHVMSIKQLVRIPKLVPPSRVSNEQAAKALNEQRMVLVIQYPQRVYEIKQHYKVFQSIVRVDSPVPVSVPVCAALPIPEPEVDSNYFLKYTIPSMLPPPVLHGDFEESIHNIPKINQGYEGWDEQGVAQPLAVPLSQSQAQPNNYFNSLRMSLGFGQFSPILTDEEQVQQEKVDLASNLLNSINDIKKIAPQPAQSRDKAYPPYYPNYIYQPPQPYRVHMDNRRDNPMPYGPMGPENPLAASNPMGQIYNPIAGNKYPMNPMYKNPIVYNPRAPAQLPQYYRTNADQEMYGQQYQGYPK